MKLKKIASLMLAGVMAVSMLAGCSNGSSNNGGASSSEPTTTTGYSSTLYGKLGSIAKSKISFSDSTALNNALTKAMGYAGNDTLVYEFLTGMKSGTVAYVHPDGGSAMGLAAQSLADTLKTEDTSAFWKASSAVNVLNPVEDDDQYKDDDMSVVLLFAVDGKVAMDAALTQVADQIDDAIASLHVDDDEVVSGEEASKIRYTYTGSVGADTLTYTEGHGVSVTFIAVQLNRAI